MVIVIDGYNLLRLVFDHHREAMDRAKKLFAQQLSIYFAAQRPQIQQIVVVYDAGPFSHATREIYHDIVIMHAGQKSSADEWILDFAQRIKTRPMLLVSMDRKLKDACARYNVDAIDVDIFYDRVKMVINKQRQAGHAMPAELGETAVYQHEDDMSFGSDEQMKKEDIDELMHAAAGRAVQKPDEREEKESRTRRGSTLSKQEKKHLKIIKKL